MRFNFIKYSHDLVKFFRILLSFEFKTRRAGSHLSTSLDYPSFFVLSCSSYPRFQIFLVYFLFDSFIFYYISPRGLNDFCIFSLFYSLAFTAPFFFFFHFFVHSNRSNLEMSINSVTPPTEFADGIGCVNIC